MRELALKLARVHPALEARMKRWTEREWSGARNFLAAMFWLLIALALVLNGSALVDRGVARRDLELILWGWGFNLLGLLITGYVTFKLVPRLARGTPLRWLFYQVDYKLTRGGIAYAVGTLVIGLAALNTGNNLLFIIVSSQLAGILMSGVLSRVALTGIGLKLALPDHIFARQTVVGSLTLENRKQSLPSFSLTVSGEAAENSAGDQRKEKAARAADRRILSEPVYFPYIPRGRRVTQAVELTFPRRGRYTQDLFQVSSKFPFGFLLKTRQVAAASEVVVYPPVEPTEEFYEILPLISGEMMSYYKGRGHDLYSIRDYQPSDSARSMDWKATAKAQALKVREFTREDERRVELVFDTFLPAAERTPEGRERFERAVTFCACLAWHFYEIDAELKFRSPEWETAVAPAGDVIYEVLRNLAFIEPRWQRDSDFLQQIGQETDTFKILLTAGTRGSIPTGLWSSAYVVFLQSL